MTWGWIGGCRGLTEKTANNGMYERRVSERGCDQRVAKLHASVRSTISNSEQERVFGSAVFRARLRTKRIEKETNS